MNSLLVCLVVVAVASAQPTRVKRGHIEEHGHGHGHATSYQNFNLESYHPVPVYKKHEHVVHKGAYEHLSSDDGDLGGHALSLGGGEHEDHEGYGLGEGSYHRSSLTDSADHGDDGYAHLGAAAVSEGGEEGYEGHGSY